MNVKKLQWLERKFAFGAPIGMLPFFLERMDGTLPRIEKKIRGINDNILSHKLDGKWSIKENIGHLADLDVVALKRVGEIVSGISPISPATLQVTRDFNAMPTEELLAYFSEKRKANLQQYDHLTPDDLVKSSLHPRLKIMVTPVDLALFHAEHDDHHLVRMNEILLQLKTPDDYVNTGAAGNL
jgi:hypothetical protein